MLSHTLRASRQSLFRAARQSHGISARRTLITPTAVRSADLVQELYVREIKAYKAPPVKASEADSHVQKFTPPKPPASPEEADIANDLKAYETQEAEVEGQSSEGGSAAVEDWFEEEEEDEKPAAVH